MCNWFSLSIFNLVQALLGDDFDLLCFDLELV